MYPENQLGVPPLPSNANRNEYEKLTKDKNCTNIYREHSIINNNVTKLI